MHSEPEVPSKTYRPRDDRLARLIQQQMDLQVTLGFNVGKMNLAERIEYIKEMYIATVKELGEAMDEVTWKSWSPGADYLDVNAFFGELRDALQTLINMVWATFPAATGPQLADMVEGALDRKTQVNLERFHSGVHNKCGVCKRALDDESVACTEKVCAYIS